MPMDVPRKKREEACLMHGDLESLAKVADEILSAKAAIEKDRPYLRIRPSYILPRCTFKELSEQPFPHARFYSPQAGEVHIVGIYVNNISVFPVEEKEIMTFKGAEITKEALVRQVGGFIEEHEGLVQLLKDIHCVPSLPETYCEIRHDLRGKGNNFYLLHLMRKRADNHALDENVFNPYGKYFAADLRNAGKFGFGYKLVSFPPCDWDESGLDISITDVSLVPQTVFKNIVDGFFSVPDAPQ
ncbi:MAG: hypothetical protein V1743_01090 [Nanoarchaeota archaeon]